jgi:hypothetical protein
LCYISHDPRFLGGSTTPGFGKRQTGQAVAFRV